jgi:hypothetical protein
MGREKGKSDNEGEVKGKNRESQEEERRGKKKVPKTTQEPQRSIQVKLVEPLPNHTLTIGSSEQCHSTGSLLKSNKFVLRPCQ